MKNIACFLIICLSVFSPLFSQTTQNYYIMGSGGASRLFLQSTMAPSLTKFNAKYLNSEWKLGVMQTTNRKIITDVAFMYNVTKDKFEMRADINPEIVERITFDGKVFIYSQYIKDGNLQAGYFEQLSEGSSVLLRKYYVHTVSGKKGAFGYEAHQNVGKDLYLKIDGKPAVFIRNKKTDIINVLSDYKEEVEIYIRKNHLKMTQKKDIIQLLHYYSTLGSESD